MERFVIHPEMDEDSAPYWHSLQEHKTKLQKCDECGKFRFPPSPSCYYCASMEGRWELISGRGTIYSWIVVHHPVDKGFAGEVPFVVALVDLDEGPRIVGRFFGGNEGEMKMGMPVKIGYDDVSDDLTLVRLEPL